MHEEAVIEAFVPAHVVDALVGALRDELDLLETSVRRAEQAAEDLEGRVGPAPTLEEDVAVVRVAGFVDQLDVDGGARRRASLEDGQVLADRRLVGGREEAEAILLGTAAPAPVEPPSDAHGGDGGDYFREILDTMRAVGPRPVAPATDAATVEAPTVAVPEPLLSVVPEPAVESASGLDDDDPAAEERFQRFWEPVAEVAEERVQQRRLAATLLLPFATVPVLLVVLLLWAF